MPPASNDYFIEFLNVPVEEQAAAEAMDSRCDWATAAGTGCRASSSWGCSRGFGDVGRRARIRGAGNDGAVQLAVAPGGERRGDRVRGVPRASRGAQGPGARAARWRTCRGGTRPRRGSAPWREAIGKGVPARPGAQHAGGPGRACVRCWPTMTVMEQARKTTESGLLSGMGIDVPAMRGVGERMLVDAMEPLGARRGGRGVGRRRGCAFGLRAVSAGRSPAAILGGDRGL